jgi:hypothetical protein
MEPSLGCNNIERSEKERQHIIFRKSLLVSFMKLMLEGRGSPPIFWTLLKTSVKPVFFGGGGGGSVYDACLLV